MDYSLSTIDLRNALGNKVKIMKYEKLKNKKSLAHILSQGVKYLIILYEWKHNYGHWCMIMKQGKGYEFFDPYGTKPDAALQKYTKNIRNEFGMEFPQVARLLRYAGKPVSYNQFHLQKRGPNITTCGRWVLWRAFNDDVPIETAVKRDFKGVKNKDQKVVTLTRQLIGK